MNYLYQVLSFLFIDSLKVGDEVGDAISFTVGVSDWSNTPNTYLPEITEYKGLISEELKGYAGLPTV
jgi:hypothetical protein